MTKGNPTAAQKEAFHASQIAVLNDELRASIDMPKPRTIVLTAGVNDLVYSVASEAQERQTELFNIIKNYSDFSEDNNPHGERDFGVFEWQGTKCFWKIDYYDKVMKWGSPDPADEDVTHRVLTILLASEY